MLTLMWVPQKNSFNKKKLIKLDTFEKYHIFITKQIKTQMKNLHIILLDGLAIADEDTFYNEMV